MSRGSRAHHPLSRLVAIEPLRRSPPQGDAQGKDECVTRTSGVNTASARGAAAARKEEGLLPWSLSVSMCTKPPTQWSALT
ncbi:MAG: hypothetical protein ACXVX1_05500, partial [Mycobacterium sp.]